MILIITFKDLLIISLLDMETFVLEIVVWSSGGYRITSEHFLPSRTSKGWSGCNYELTKILTSNHLDK